SPGDGRPRRGSCPPRWCSAARHRGTVPDHPATPHISWWPRLPRREPAHQPQRARSDASPAPHPSAHPRLPPITASLHTTETPHSAQAYLATVPSPVCQMRAFPPSLVVGGPPTVVERLPPISGP